MGQPHRFGEAWRPPGQLGKAAFGGWRGWAMAAALWPLRLRPAPTTRPQLWGPGQPWGWARPPPCTVAPRVPPPGWVAICGAAPRRNRPLAVCCGHGQQFFVLKTGQWLGGCTPASPFLAVETAQRLLAGLGFLMAGPRCIIHGHGVFFPSWLMIGCEHPCILAASAERFRRDMSLTLTCVNCSFVSSCHTNRNSALAAQVNCSGHHLDVYSRRE